MSMLSDATRVKVERVLGCMSAADAGNWMDEIRSDLKYKYTAPKGDIITALNKAYTEQQHVEKLSPER